MLIIPALVKWATAIDVIENALGNNAIVFENDDGSTWMHGQNPEHNQFSAHDLSTLPRGLIGSTRTAANKAILDAETRPAFG